MSLSTACSPSCPDAAYTAFDQIADSYDELFTRSVIGRAQRAAVWRVLTETFHPGDHVLELNCGTGEDALFLARTGISVTACDASPAMIDMARKRRAAEGPGSPIEFQTRRTEEIRGLQAEILFFDGVLSNFSGLNCVQDLQQVARNLAPMMKQRAKLVLCLSTRICIWEICWFSGHLNFSKALRRIRGSAVARIGEATVSVWYPTVKDVQRAFAPWFRLDLVRAIGLCVPPSYLEHWAAKHPHSISYLASADRILARIPVLRRLGDHVLLRLEKATS